MHDVFLICPVRGASEEKKKAIAEYIKKLEQRGKSVYYPARDTNQDDDVGYRIITDNRKALREAREVHIWYDPASQGSIFDLGMAWNGDKPLVIANPEDIKPTKDKSFANVILKWCEMSKNG